MMAVLICWTLCGIITVAGGFPDDPNQLGYKARTDAKISALTQANVLYVPYPCNYQP